MRQPTNAQSVAFSPNGAMLATGDLASSIKLWNAANGEEIASLEGHTALVFSVRFSRDGKTLTSASKDGTARLWQVPAVEKSPDRQASR